MVTSQRIDGGTVNPDAIHSFIEGKTGTLPLIARVIARGVRHPRRAMCGAATEMTAAQKAATKAASEGTEDARDQRLG
jgi:hypothetical protein